MELGIKNKQWLIPITIIISSVLPTIVGGFSKAVMDLSEDKEGKD